MGKGGRGRGDRDSRPKIRTSKQKDPNVGKPGKSTYDKGTWKKK